MLSEYLAVLLLIHAYVSHKGICGIVPCHGVVADCYTAKAADVHAAPGRADGPAALPSPKPPPSNKVCLVNIPEIVQNEEIVEHNHQMLILARR